MEHVYSAGGIVIGNGNKIIVVTNELRKTTLPKGRSEKNETPKQTAKREVLEECGIHTVTIVKELGTIIRPGFTDENTITPSVIKHIRIYLFKTDEITLNPQVEDIHTAEWIEPADASKVLSWQEEIQFIEKHKDELRF